MQYLKQEQQDTERRLGTSLGRRIYFSWNKGKLKTTARSTRLAAWAITDLIGNARTFKFWGGGASTEGVFDWSYSGIRKCSRVLLQFSSTVIFQPFKLYIDQNVFINIAKQWKPKQVNWRVFFKFILIAEYGQSNTPFKAILRQSWFQMDPIQKGSRLIGLLFIRSQQGPIFGPAKSGFDFGSVPTPNGSGTG